MKIYVIDKNIVAIAQKDVLKIDNAEVYDVENIPNDYRKYDFIDGKFVLNEEKEAKIKELEAEEVKKQIEKRATEFVKKQLDALDYDNEGEVALYATNEDSEWHDEAVALQKWIEEIYKKMYELEESVTIDNYSEIDLNKIEAEYPVFEKGAE